MITKRVRRALGFLGMLAMTAIASPDWPNEPAGSQVLIDCPFDGSVCNFTNVYNSASYANDPTAPLSGPSVFDTHMDAGSSNGNGKWAYESIPHAQELYIGTWWKTNAEFQGLANNVNKMIFVWDDMANNFWQWHRHQDQPGIIAFGFETNTYNCHLPNLISPDCSFGGTAAHAAPNVTTTSIAQGSGWHRLEMYHKASTTPTSKDGVLRWWVDGVLQGNHTNVNYGSGFTAVQITHTWDNSVLCNPPYRDMSRSWHHYWDHLRVSVPNCGSNCPTNIPLMITSPISTSAQVGKAYLTTLKAENGKAPYGWTISAGSLPQGLTLNKTTGVISGTPISVGRSDFTVKVTDSNVPAGEATKAFTIIVSNCSGCTGIGEKKLSVAGSRLTANPRKGGVSFHTPKNGTYSLQVYDLSGREVWRHSGSGEAVWNHGGKIRKGLYLFSVKQNGRTMMSQYAQIW